jgi:hypothetical protein
MNEQIKRLIKQGESNTSITLMTGVSYVNNLRNELNFEKRQKNKKNN